MSRLVVVDRLVGDDAMMARFSANRCASCLARRDVGSRGAGRA